MLGVMLGAAPMLAGVCLSARSERDDFLALARLLSGRVALDAGAAERIRVTFSTQDPEFSGKCGRLSAAVRAEELTNMRRFSVFAADYPDLAPIASAIISEVCLGSARAA